MFYSYQSKLAFFTNSFVVSARQVVQLFGCCTLHILKIQHMQFNAKPPVCRKRLKNCLILSHCTVIEQQHALHCIEFYNSKSVFSNTIKLKLDGSEILKIIVIKTSDWGHTVKAEIFGGEILPIKAKNDNWVVRNFGTACEVVVLLVVKLLRKSM
jgi:hypothetical protein